MSQDPKTLMSHPLIERRRVPRVSSQRESRVSVGVSLPVRVLDVSRSGVLLESKAELRVGDRAELHATLADRSLSLVIEVRHVSIETPPRTGARFKAGAVFVEPAAEQLLLIDQMLGTESA